MWILKWFFRCAGMQLNIKKKPVQVLPYDFHVIFEKIKEADGLVLGSPVYGADISAKMKNLLIGWALPVWETQKFCGASLERRFLLSAEPAA